MASIIDVVIVGAGPFGLSIAAHLRGRGVDFRIIGKPLSFWQQNMPEGMQLKSTGFSSTLYDPGETFTIGHFCLAQGIPYADVGLPVRRETFTAYGLAFQKRFVPQVEEVELVALRRSPDGFTLVLGSGEILMARHVILAVGLDAYRHVPRALSHLPRQCVSHSAEHHDLKGFYGRDVIVIGGGSSAIDLAVLLHEAQANVRLVARKANLAFGLDEPLWRPIWRRLQRPMSGIGPGWKNRFCTDAPWLIRHFPKDVRLGLVNHFLAPAGGWFMRDRAAAVPKLLAYEVEEARLIAGRVQLQLASPKGGRRQISADHVIAATGYQTDLSRLPFISGDILAQLKLVDGAPRLSAHFESSVQGLYFVGPVSAASFGPVMRFAVGAGFTSRNLARHLGARRAGFVPVFRSQRSHGAT